MHAVLGLFSILAIADASVDFSYSTLYDVYDFVGVDEVHITKCDSGCLIFASTLGAFPEYPDSLDPYGRNLFIHDNDEGTSTSVTTLADHLDTYHRKVPLEIMGPANISVLNTNKADATPYSIVLFVIEMDKAQEFTYPPSFDRYTYSVYDPSAVSGGVKPDAEIMTIISAQPFFVKAGKGKMWLDITARLTGFENVFENNEDECPFAFKIPATTDSPGIHLQVNSPIISVYLWRNADIEFELGVDNSDTRDLSEDGFITSPGYNGCKKLNSGGFQNFRSPLYQNSADIVLTSDDSYKVDVDVLPFLDTDHYMRIIDNDAVVVANVFGTQEKHLSYPKTRSLNVAYANIPDTQGFLMRYSTTPADPKTTTSMKPSTTVKPSTMTTSRPTMTTKGSSATTTLTDAHPDVPTSTSTTSGSVSSTTVHMTTSASWSNGLALDFIITIIIFIALD